MKPLVIACLASVAAAGGMARPARAQVPPTDAGSILREQVAPLPPVSPPETPELDLGIPEPPAAAATGGPQVRIESIAFKGNSAFPEDKLLAALGDFAGQDYDLGGLTGLANRVTLHYRRNGYPFARAFIPAQTLTAGRLLVEIIEGRFGAVTATGEAPLDKGAQRYLKPLRPGALIESAQLERTLLILTDAPGARIESVVRPGELPGTGDLLVRVEPTRRWDFSVEFDDYGSRYSGLYRMRAELGLNRVLMFGDRLSIRSLYSTNDLWLGGFTYDLPLAANGLRGYVSFDRTTYTLSGDFNGFSGLASVATAGFNYPLLRSQSANATLTGGFTDKNFEDFLQGATYNTTRSQSGFVGLRFDRRDTFAGGGSNFGSLTASTGHSSTTTPTLPQGAYDKLDGQVARVHNLPGPVALFVNVLFQIADGAVTTAEGFSLGGPSKVRAYSLGEALGSRGVVGQFELRLKRDVVYPFVFYDVGHVPKLAAGGTRNLRGVGVGLRIQGKNLFGDFSAGWKTHGGPSLADTVQTDPQVWFRLGYKF